MQSLTLDSVVDVRMAAAREHTVTLTEIRVIASEKQPGMWLNQKRLSLIRDFNHLSPGDSLGNLQRFDHHSALLRI